MNGVILAANHSSTKTTLPPFAGNCCPAGSRVDRSLQRAALPAAATRSGTADPEQHFRHHFQLLVLELMICPSCGPPAVEAYSFNGATGVGGMARTLTQPRRFRRSLATNRSRKVNTKSRSMPANVAKIQRRRGASSGTWSNTAGRRGFANPDLERGFSLALGDRFSHNLLFPQPALHSA